MLYIPSQFGIPFQRLLHGLLLIDIAERSVDDTDEILDLVYLGRHLMISELAVPGKKGGVEVMFREA